MTASVLAEGPLANGYQLDHYTIEEVLGAGSFGITYKAWDEGLQTRVAIKEYFPADFARRITDTAEVAPLPGQEELYYDVLEKFLEEARIQARFKHPNIIRVHRYLKANSTAYLVMDYEEGESLEDLLKRENRCLTERECLDIFVPILRGLARVHQESVLHRDIKPANIYLRSQGEATLLDFGAARQLLADANAQMTVILTRGYAAPEQYSGEHVEQGPETDLYGIGATMYRCLVNRAPIESVTRITSIHNKQADPLQVSALSLGANSKISETLSNAINSMLALQQSLRPQSAEAAIKLLYAPAHSGPVSDATVMVGAASSAAPAFTASDAETEFAPPTASRLRPQQSAKGLPLFIGLVLFVLLLIPLGYFLLQGSAPSVVIESRPLTASAAPASTALDQTVKQGVEGAVELPANNEPVATEEVVIATAAPVIADPFALGSRLSHSLKNGGKGPAMVIITPGTFSMGSDNGESTESPLHSVVLASTIAIAKFETSFAEYDRFASSVEGVDRPNDAGWGRNNRPVINVSWAQAQAFARWLSDQSGHRYRLPSEAEWEFAAGGGSDLPYSMATTISVDDANYAGADGGSATIAVGKFPANDYGLHDMHGNVWEWTADCWAINYSQASADGAAFTGGDCVRRVLRGGGWNSEPALLRSRNRSAGLSKTKSAALGFRLVVEIER
ncbi:MAG: formylglycine-generating enzyme required for sulfatase activity/serine/threonine protein kinase [Paraglaciecola psychrophila]